MGSTDVLGKVADQLKLAERDEFDPNRRRLPTRSWLWSARTPELGLKDQ